MAFIEIQNLYKCFKDVVAVNRIALAVNKGEMLTLLGPSGCGKTTTLRCIAGLEHPEEGDIIIDGRPMLSQGVVPSSKRGIGMVFQNYAVWPHMKVFNNIVYGLKLEKISRQEIKRRADQVLALVGLGGLEDRYPAQLSGGQQQRVALARALVRNPKVLLLDEPLSNLDAKLREELRFEIKSLVRRMGITSVYVTHDQAEAMVISDRVAVMQSGNVVQIGSPQEIYKQPASKFVADFIGTMNFMPCEIVEIQPSQGTALVRTAFSNELRCKMDAGTTMKPGDALFASIRPEDVEIVTSHPGRKENVYQGTIIHRAYLGNFLYFFANVGDTQVRVQASHNVSLEEGAVVDLFLDPEKCMLLS